MGQTVPDVDMRQEPPVRSKREIYAVMSGLMIAMLLAMLDNLIVGTAMPTIVGDLGGLEHLSWVVTAYALTTAVSTPVWAKLGDLYGRKGIFMASIVVFLVGSALSGLSQNMMELIVFRAIQGIGAGGLMVGATAIVGDLVPPRDRGRYQGLMAAVMPLAFIGGPLLGGFLTDNLSWRWAFYINLPLGVVALIVVWFTMHLPRVRREAKIDWLGAGTLAVAISALTLLTSWGGSQYPWGSWQIVGLGVLTVVGTALFVRIERRVSEPILSLELFRNRNFSAATVVSFLTGFAMFGAVTYLPQYQQIVQGASATSSGLLLLPLMGGMLVTSLLSGQLVSRTGRYKVVIITGSLLMAAGLGLLSLMGLATTQLTTSLFMVVLGVGMGLLMQTTMLVMQNSVAQRDIGASSGASTLFRTVGGSLGVSLLGVFYTTRLTATLSDRLGTAGGEQITGGQITPAMLGGLPAAVRDAYQAAVASGTTTAFMWAGIVGLVAVLAALVIREVPLRGSAPEAAGTMEGVVPAHLGQTTGPAPVHVLAGTGAGKDAGRGSIVTAPMSGRVDATSHRDGPGLFGIVSRGDGGRLGQVVVTVTDPAGRQEARTSTAADGSYRVALPTGGMYLVVVATGTYQPHARLVAVADRPSRHDVSLTGASSVFGVVQAPDPAGGLRSVGGANVTLIDAQGDVTAAAIAEPDGHYRLAGVPDGIYTLTAVGPGRQPVAVSVRLDIGAAIKRDIELPQRSRLLGTVTTASTGHGVPEAMATLVDSTGTVVASTVTGPDGTFAFDDLTAGTYTLTATGYAPATRVVHVTAGAQAAATVALGAPTTGPAPSSPRATAPEVAHLDVVGIR
jgi:EmrB/QacA subfamily drug resistance transporter